MLPRTPFKHKGGPEMTPTECLWYAVIYAYLWIGTGYHFRRVVESIKTSEKRIGSPEESVIERDTDNSKVEGG